MDSGFSQMDTALEQWKLWHDWPEMTYDIDRIDRPTANVGQTSTVELSVTRLNCLNYLKAILSLGNAGPPYRHRRLAGCPLPSTPCRARCVVTRRFSEMSTTGESTTYVSGSTECGRCHLYSRTFDLRWITGSSRRALTPYHRILCGTQPRLASQANEA